MTNDGLKGEQVATGVHRAADCFMARWHRDLAERSWLRHTASNTKSGGKGQPGDCEAVLIALSTKAQNEIAPSCGNLCYCYPEH